MARYLYLILKLHLCVDPVLLVISLLLSLRKGRLLQLRALGLPADVIIKPYVLTRLNLVNAIVIELCHQILLLGGPYVVRSKVRSLWPHHLRLLHRVDCLRHGLVREQIASILLHVRQLSCLIIILGFNKLLMVHLFAFELIDFHFVIYLFAVCSVLHLMHLLLV